MRVLVRGHVVSWFKQGDNMAEWLRRQPAKLMGYARVGSNPTVVVFHVATLIQLAKSMMTPCPV
jgi:hypothetical protein